MAAGAHGHRGVSAVPHAVVATELGLDNATHLHRQMEAVSAAVLPPTPNHVTLQVAQVRLKLPVQVMGKFSDHNHTIMVLLQWLALCA